MSKPIYAFEEGNKEMRNLLGGKGCNLAEMTTLGFPVPPGFTITTDYCNQYLKNLKHEPHFDTELHNAVSSLETKMSKKFGDAKNPLLLSVRSGARVSMPGMMDTVLNLGLNDTTVKALATQSGNERFAYDAYRRFLNMFGDVVLGVHHDYFEAELKKIKKAMTKKTRNEKQEINNHSATTDRTLNKDSAISALDSASSASPAHSALISASSASTKDSASSASLADTDLTADDWKTVIKKYKSIIKRNTGREFPSDPWEQLNLAIIAVFNSWNCERAIIYRKINKIPRDWGTAVNVQSMVFGNLGEDSGTGVAFTRNPSTGERHYFGEYLMNAQGEDVVAGIRTPLELEHLKTTSPKAYSELTAIFEKLEHHYRDMQDIEFTIENGKLYMLQTRSGKRTGRSAVRIAIDMVKEGLIDEKTALLRVDPYSLDQLLHPMIDPTSKEKPMTKGIPASPGAVSGTIVFTADSAVKAKESGRKVILVRPETSPEDIAGMHSAEGILTAVGGMTSHAAVVARGMGKCCVSGATQCQIDVKKKTITIGDITLTEKDTITLSGSTGEVFAGTVAKVDPIIDDYFGTLMSWADKYRKIKIRTNAETPSDCRKAVEFGAEGIGLCRTEHMFFDEARILHVREMILANDQPSRIKAIDKLLPYQKNDFKELFEIMNGRPVTIRLLDPPLHEFLPQEPSDKRAVAKELGVTLKQLEHKIIALHEFNPMLGHRGVRLSVTYPELAVMQVKAIISAAIEVKKSGIEVHPEIMIPLVGVKSEMVRIGSLIRRHADSLIAESGIQLPYLVGTMIEVPRACVIARHIAKYAEFFSFGTNDLTQMTFGLSRDDATKFMSYYLDKGFYKDDPFQSLDQTGVGRLMKMAIDLGRKSRPDIKLGICGEHGGDPKSIRFCIEAGLDYVSCSPFRIPIAKLTAAQAAISEAK